jgi:hypothetical protein
MFRRRMTGAIRPIRQLYSDALNGNAEPPSCRGCRHLVALPEAANALPEAANALPEAANALPEAANALPEAATLTPETRGDGVCRRFKYKPVEEVREDEELCGFYGKEFETKGRLSHYLVFAVPFSILLMGSALVEVLIKGVPPSA